MTRKRAAQLLALLAVLLVPGLAATPPAAVQAGARPKLISVTPPTLDAVNCSVTPAKTSLSADEQAFLTLLNNFRAAGDPAGSKPTALGLPAVGPVQLDARLVASSAWFSQDHAQNGYQTSDPTGHNNPDHVDSLGRYIDKRLSDCDFPTNIHYAENVWFAWPPSSSGASAQGAFDGWYNLCDGDANGNNCTYAHRRTMLDPNATVAGIALAVGPKGGPGTPDGQSAAHWTLDVGDPGAGNAVAFPPQAGSTGGTTSAIPAGCPAPATSSQFAGQWTMLDNYQGSAAIVATAGPFLNPPSLLYQLHKDGSIWQWTGGSPPNNWKELDGNPATVQIAAFSDRLYQRHSDGSVWQYTGRTPPWVMIDNNPATTDIEAAADNIYQLHSDGTIWQYTGGFSPSGTAPGNSGISGSGNSSWKGLDYEKTTKAIVADGDSVYQLQSDGSIWQMTGGTLPWKKLDGNSATAQIVASQGYIFQRHSDGSIWTYTGSPAWPQLDNNSATTSIVAADFLYQLHRDGSIWQFTGTPDHTAWTQLDDNPWTVQVAGGGGGVFQLLCNGEILEKNP
jgi:uncharacterized protein YkwD